MIYLDHAATSFPKAPGVIEAMTGFLQTQCGNPGRGGHRLTVEASRAIEGARTAVAALLDADPERTLFGPGATFWLNALCHTGLQPGDRVVTSALEHNSVMRPLRWMESHHGVEVTVVPGAAGTGVPTAKEIRTAVLEKPTAMVLITHASNVTGAVLPVEDIARSVAPVPVVVDGAQTAGVYPFSFAGSRTAAFVCSGHKGLHGPSGTGVLLLREDFTPRPFLRGGTGSRSESEVMPSHLPDRLEAGTPNGAGIAGLGAAARWLSDRGIESVHQHEARLIERLEAGLTDIPGIRIHGRPAAGPSVGVLSFTVDGDDLGDLASWLDREHDLAVRAGLHCSPAAHRRVGTFPDGTIRAAVGPTSGETDIDALIDALRHRSPTA